MDYEIIFYHAGMTAENENALTKALAVLPMVQTGACAATTPKDLAKELSNSLSRVKSVFIIGGLDGGTQSTERILSKILSGKKSDLTSNKIELPNVSEKGYFIRCMDQTIVVLPDNSQVIERMIANPVLSELEKVYSLKRKEQDEYPNIREISNKLDTQLSDAARTRVTTPKVAVLAEEIQERSRGAKLAISILLFFAGAEFLAAVILYLIFYIL
ncbi:MAG: hypothetical protein ACI4M3_04715 [Acutalibacteraceae bacterium]